MVIALYFPGIITGLDHSRTMNCLISKFFEYSNDVGILTLLMIIVRIYSKKEEFKL